MEQIYYTQCPVGYGLGVSNGFQIKRLSPGYPVTGDFRPLGLKAFLAGTRTLAPTVLRYRRTEDNAAEVASLVPRTHEFETERGLWGRPGGHFAHGIQLDDDALRAIGHWPAALLGSNLWKRSDPERSLGRPPDSVSISSATLPLPASFETLTRLAKGIDEGRLARLISALADVARDGRTLVVLERPDRLAGRIQLLTLAFPETFRGLFTFSTYHDRPEELLGFRLQGTAPDPRANRLAWRALGYLADFSSGGLEPEIAPARWAMTLARWIVRGSESDRNAWESVDRYSQAAWMERPGEPPSLWPAEWLDRLYELPGLGEISSDVSPDWGEIQALAAWAREAKLSLPVIEARGAEWWSRNVGADDVSRGAFLEHLKTRESWASPDASASWARAMGRWLEDASSERREEFLSSAFVLVPESKRPRFAETLVRCVSPEVSSRVIAWLKSRPGIDARVLFPLEARAAVQRVAAGGKASEVAELFRRAAAAKIAFAEACDVLEAAMKDQPGEIRRAIARGVALSAARGEESTTRAFLRWASARPAEFPIWVDNLLRTLAMDRSPLERLSNVYSWVDPPLKGDLTREALNVALEPNSPPEIFRWTVETRLLTTAEAERPGDRRWAGAYLDRVPSGLDLFEHIFLREYRHLGLKRWLDEAAARGELSPSQVERLEKSVRFARALKSGSPKAIHSTDLPEVHAEERGAVLSRVLERLTDASDGAVMHVLVECSSAWPDGFRPGAPGLAAIAEVLASRLLSDLEHPDRWLGRLVSFMTAVHEGYEPSSLAAEVVAATTRSGDNGQAFWRLRAFLLADPSAWPALAADVRDELRGCTASKARAKLEEWDQKLVKGIHTSRFFELWLNNCDGPALASVVSVRANDLRTLADLKWWESSGVPSARNDIREAVARQVPLAPLAAETLSSVQAWMRRGPRVESGGSGVGVADDLVPLDDDPPSAAPVPVARPASGTTSFLSEYAAARWRCLDALSTLYRPGLDAVACRQAVEGWMRDLPLNPLPKEERYLFLMWLIPRLSDMDSVQIARLASCLVRQGMTEPDRVASWAEAIRGRVTITEAMKEARAPFIAELRAEWRTVVNESRERPGR